MTSLEDFIAFHTPGLEIDEARHNLILGLFGGTASSATSAMLA